MAQDFNEKLSVKDAHAAKPAIFLDRDGVLTEERSYVTSKEDLRLFPYAAQCVKQIRAMGYLAIVVTNQSGIARGLFTEDTLKEMNAYLMEETKVDAIYYCPHHPEGRVHRYAQKCSCRKPGTGMIEQACRDFNIDLRSSLVVGDRASDIKLGQNAGLATALLESGYGTARLEETVAPDYILEDLRDVVQLLMNSRQKTSDNK